MLRGTEEGQDARQHVAMLAAGLIHSARHEYADRPPNSVADTAVMMSADLQRAFDILVPSGNTESLESGSDENTRRLALIEQARLSRQERRDANAALDIGIANTHNSPHDEVNKGSPVRSERIGTREGVRP